MRKLLITLPLLLGGCASATHFGDGNVLVECGDLSACIKKLSAECPNGFDVVGRDSSVRPVYVNGMLSSYSRNDVIAKCR